MTSYTVSATTISVDSPWWACLTTNPGCTTIFLVILATNSAAANAVSSASIANGALTSNYISSVSIVTVVGVKESSADIAVTTPADASSTWRRSVISVWRRPVIAASPLAIVEVVVVVVTAVTEAAPDAEVVVDLATVVHAQLTYGKRLG